MALLIPCIHFTHVSSRGRAQLSGCPLQCWSATASPAAPRGDLPRSLQASKLAHPNSLLVWGVTSSLLTVEGKWCSRLWFSALHSCRDASVLQLLLSLWPSLPAWQERAGGRSRGCREAGSNRNGAGLAAWGAGVHRHGPKGKCAVAGPAVPCLQPERLQLPFIPSQPGYSCFLA